MEGFSLFLGIVFVIIGILQIILFFKVWIMTNDVREIKNNTSSNTDLSIIMDAQIAYMKEQKDKAKDLLDSALYKSLLQVAEGEPYNYRYQVELISSSYKRIYEKMNFEMPDVEPYKNINNLPIDISN